MTSSVKDNIENVIVPCTYAFTYVCQISRHLIEAFLSYLANKKVVRNKKNI